MTATRLLEDDAQFAALAVKLAADLRGNLDLYEIADRATLKQFYSTLGALALLEGRHDVALAYADSVRNIEDKPALRALAGTLERAAQCSPWWRRPRGAARSRGNSRPGSWRYASTCGCFSHPRPRLQPCSVR
jgi:hypothetical protein